MLYVVCFQGYVCGSEGVLVLKVSDYVSGRLQEGHAYVILDEDKDGDKDGIAGRPCTLNSPAVRDAPPVGGPGATRLGYPAGPAAPTASNPHPSYHHEYHTQI